ncbi:GtrA family protein [Paenibacillus sp. DYY-L-2]|uniref:GtrA family protein n=1 Tax=Paenibacillus sp. DYY-L-2 TaxID=3447013 RepID=UPI003F50D1C6
MKLNRGMKKIRNLLNIIKKESTFSKFIKYGLVGVLGTLTHTLVLTLCVEFFACPAVLGTIIGFIFSLIVSFKLNTSWTFSNVAGSNLNFVKYALTCSMGLLINVVIMYVIVDIFKMWYLLAQFSSIIIVPIFNFTLTKKWVFKDVKKI